MSRTKIRKTDLRRSLVGAGTFADLRRIGVRPTGVCWGALGDQIDARSGNPNFTLPLL